MQTETLIIGGGLAGLSLASQLARRGEDFLLLEARDRLGGRILTETKDGGYFDLGPAWFWPGQPRIAELITRLGLSHFEQYSQGDAIYEDERGNIQRVRGYASMEGSYRLVGGLNALISAMAAELPEDRLRISTPIAEVAKTTRGVSAKTLDCQVVSARRAVLALPPRVASQLTYEPALPEESQLALEAIPTWMAGQAKAVAVYDRPFWRDAGLSGDAISRRGPMAEIHDASCDAGECFGLFGFIGVPPRARPDQQSLRDHLHDQLSRVFGDEAAAPKALYVKDWAFDPFTATDFDLQPLYTHPLYSLPLVLQGLWDERLLFGGTEVAQRFGGYLEGALEAAENNRILLERVRA